MKKITVYFVLAIGILPFMSCARGIVANESVNDSAKDVAKNDMPCDCSASYTPTETSVIVKKETQKMLRSPIDKIAGADMGEYTYYFVMHENKSFSVIVNLHGTQQYDFRAGTFQSEGDTLNLNYYKNLKSAYLTDRVVVDNNKNEISFLSNGPGETKRLKILNHIPRSLIVMLFTKRSPKDQNLASGINSTESAVMASR